MVSLELDHVAKRFTGQTAVDDLSLTVPDGELFCLLGPSGCGKSTTLQMIAGLIRPDSGRIRVGGTDITDTPVQRRNIGVVFQNFALFPHLTAAQNVAYGLKARRRPAAEIATRVGEMLEFVGLAAKAGRHPRALSGGEQQRVALARALAIDPDLLLLDEPFSSLDRELRLELRTELARIQHETKVTMVFVTHDQDEAFAIADSVGVCDAGRLQQVAPPRELYDTPANPFVARFVGRSNLLPAAAVPGTSTVDGTLLVRPENVQTASTPPDGRPTVEGVVETVEYGGDGTLYHVAALGRTIVVARPSRRREDLMIPGDRVHLWWDAEDSYLLPTT
jgi:putative spermidine/putrescine transport system ATP-binding protein